MQKKKSYILSISVVFQTFFLVLVWYLLVGQSPWSWVIGVPAIMLSLAVLHFLPPLVSFHFNITKLFPFIAYFLQQSVVSGIDVAARALNPKPPLNLSFLKYKINISNSLARVFFTNSISMLPGTLSVSLGDEYILVHVLDEKYPNTENLYVLERKIAAMFSEDI